MPNSLHIVPVREPCFQEALQNREPWGIWGGADVIDRKLAAMNEGLPVPRIMPPHGTNTRYAKHAVSATFVATLIEPMNDSEGDAESRPNMSTSSARIAMS